MSVASAIRTVAGGGGFGQYNAILMYHSVGGGLHDHVSPERFRADVAYLSDEYQIVDLPEAVTSRSESKNVALTFDDGYRDFYEYVVPVLREFDVPATVFVIAATLFEDGFVHDDAYPYEYMTPSQLRELVEDDLVTIGNHTRTHPDLSTVTDPGRIESEVVGAKRNLERELSTTITRFAYPYNGCGGNAVDVVRRSHEYAVAGNEWDAPSYRNVSAHRLPRLNGAIDRDRLESELTDRAAIRRYVAHRGRRFVRRLTGSEE